MKWRNERSGSDVRSRTSRRRARKFVEALERVVERDEDRQLQEHRQARGSRVDLVLPVELHQLLVLLLLVVLVLLLDLLHLRRVAPAGLHRVDLLDRQRHEHIRTTTVVATIAHAHGRPRLVWNQVENVLHHGLELAEDRGSWQRCIIVNRVVASVTPRVAPQQPPAGEDAATRRDRGLRTACIAYSEQDGWYLQVVGNSAPNVSARARRGRSPRSAAREHRRRLEQPDGGPAWPARVGTFTPRSPRSCSSSSSTLLAEPGEAVRLGRLEQPWPHDQHVVVARGERVSRRSSHTSRSRRLIRFRSTAPPAARGTANPIRGSDGSSCGSQ